MKALTVKAPWGTAIATLGKDIENRSWKPPQSVIGTRIAIHQGVSVSREALEDLEDQFGAIRYELGVVACTAVLKGWVDADGSHSTSLSAREAARARRSPWYGGDVGWVLTGVRRPRAQVRLKGKLGVWKLPPRAIRRLGGSR